MLSTDDERISRTVACCSICVSLGLAISQRLARLLHGDLTVQSEVGKGSIFTVRIQCKLVKSTDAAETALPYKTVYDSFQLPVHRQHLLATTAVTVLIVSNGYATTQELRSLFTALRIPDVSMLSCSMEELNSMLMSASPFHGCFASLSYILLDRCQLSAELAQRLSTHCGNDCLLINIKACASYSTSATAGVSGKLSLPAPSRTPCPDAVLFQHAERFTCVSISRPFKHHELLQLLCSTPQQLGSLTDNSTIQPVQPREQFAAPADVTPANAAKAEPVCTSPLPPPVTTTAVPVTINNSRISGALDAAKPSSNDVLTTWTAARGKTVLTLLVVEDNLVNQKLLSSMLNKLLKGWSMPYKIEYALSGEAALQLVQQHQQQHAGFDVIFMDLSMGNTFHFIAYFFLILHATALLWPKR